MYGDGNREPEKVFKKQERLLNSVEGEGILGGQKMKKELLEAKSIEPYRKAIMFSICEENRWK